MPRVLKYAQKIVFNKFSFKKISFQHKHEKNKFKTSLSFNLKPLGAPLSLYSKWNIKFEEVVYKRSG
jgi:hypothetical protein